MATVGNTYLTLKDHFAQKENGHITNTIVDLLSQSNVLIEDAVVRECNEGSTHKTTVRNGLPEVEFRKFYQGVNASKGEYTQITDTTGMIEVYSQVDKSLADLEGDTQQFRLNEATAFVESMNNTVQKNIFYGSKATNPAGFDGLATRYNSISNDPNSIGYRVIDAGGTGSTNTSIWFITWGDLHTHLLYPKGSQMGLVHEDKGAQTATDANGNMYEVYRDHFKWDVGMTVRDFRSNARIANIDVTKLSGNSAPDLIKLMISAYHRVKRFAKTGNTVIYCNETIETYLHFQAVNKANVNLSFEDFAGKPIISFMGIPVKCADQLVNTEEAVA
ncbi:phage capsid protein [bacterium]|nr:phage capsid protein [bacterium]